MRLECSTGGPRGTASHMSATLSVGCLKQPAGRRPGDRLLLTSARRRLPRAVTTSHAQASCRTKSHGHQTDALRIDPATSIVRPTRRSAAHGSSDSPLFLPLRFGFSVRSCKAANLAEARVLSPSYELSLTESCLPCGSSPRHPEVTPPVQQKASDAPGRGLADLRAEGLTCQVIAPALIRHAPHQRPGGPRHPDPTARLSGRRRLPHERPPHAATVGWLRWLSRGCPYGSLRGLPPGSRASHVGGQYASVSTPQAMRPPAPPIGWVLWSSRFSWTTMADPSSSISRSGSTRVVKSSACTVPSAAA